MRDTETPRAGRYIGELRSRFNIIEQWDGKQWRKPPEVGDYGRTAGKIHFDVEDALHDREDADDRAFRSIR